MTKRGCSFLTLGKHHRLTYVWFARGVHMLAPVNALAAGETATFARRRERLLPGLRRSKSSIPVLPPGRAPHDIAAPPLSGIPD